MRISKNLTLSKKWSTHNTMLIKAIQASEGPILEIGAGPYSTPLIHWLCIEEGRRIYTYENSDFFHKFAKEFRSRNHVIRKSDDYSEIDNKKKWAVVFIDNHPDETRSVNALRFKDVADYIVLHDSHETGEKGYGDIWEHFKYRHDWKLARPWTSVVSNFKDLSEII